VQGRHSSESRLRLLPGDWSYLGGQEALLSGELERIDPGTIFVLHWSWKIPQELVNRREFVCFHMTDLPYGRGGSPLQNLILRGHDETMLTAFRMTAELDAGPVYLKWPMSLRGTAAEILERSSLLAADMIEELTARPRTPREQTGEPVVFARRTPEQSTLPETGSPRQLYDFIRMLDGEGYPPACIDHGKFRLSFTNASLTDNVLHADVAVRPLEEPEP